MSRNDGDPRAVRRSDGLRPVVGYAAAGAVATGAAAALAAWLSPARATAGIAWAALAAYGLQVAAFGALWKVRGRANAFFVAWGGGTLVRLGAVLALGLWLARGSADVAAPLLLSFAGFLFVLLLLEPLFFRAGLRNR